MVLYHLEAYTTKHGWRRPRYIETPWGSHGIESGRTQFTRLFMARHFAWHNAVVLGRKVAIVKSDGKRRIVATYEPNGWQHLTAMG